MDCAGIARGHIAEAVLGREGEHAGNTSRCRRGEVRNHESGSRNGLMLRWYAWLPVKPPASVAVMVMVTVPAVMFVPLRASPADREKPAGNTPAVTARL